MTWGVGHDGPKHGHGGHHGGGNATPVGGLGGYTPPSGGPVGTGAGGPNTPGPIGDQENPPGGPYGGGSTGGGNAGGGSGAMFDQGAYDAMYALLEQYGLGSLGKILHGLIEDGITDEASLTLQLQSTDEWKRRFAGNEILKQNGLGVLSVAEYLSVERSYAQVLKNYGLPQGFYDDPSDFAKFIGGNVSASELQQRAQMFSDISKREDPAIVAQLQSMGMSQGDILAYTMDPTKAMPLLQQKYQTTILGAAARRNGLATDNGYLTHLADLGVTEQQATQGYGMIAENLGAVQNLAGVYGSDYSQHDFETEVFEQNGAAANKRKRLASKERAAFGGSSGVTQGSLSASNGGSY